MAWSDKYKKSIDCDNPKGFSQKAHCAGRRKKAKELAGKSKQSRMNKYLHNYNANRKIRRGKI